MPDKIQCLICGRDFTGSAPEARFFHIVTAHTREVLAKPEVQTFLKGLQGELFSIGENFAKKLRGAK
jgi:hypothetical protein